MNFLFFLWKINYVYQFEILIKHNTEMENFESLQHVINIILFNLFYNGNYIKVIQTNLSKCKINQLIQNFTFLNLFKKFWELINDKCLSVRWWNQKSINLRMKILKLPGLFNLMCSFLAKLKYLWAISRSISSSNSRGIKVLIFLCDDIVIELKIIKWSGIVGWNLTPKNLTEGMSVFLLYLLMNFFL